MTFKTPEQYRVTRGAFRTSLEADGLNGMFWVPSSPGKPPLKVIATDGTQLIDAGLHWEHVSVSLPGRCPTWEEMCKVKALFWDDEDCVMQLHPPRSEWVNNHRFCLHLWRPIGVEIPRPPAIAVGIKSIGVLA